MRYLFVALALFVCSPAWALEDNPDAPVGMVGIVLSADRSTWGGQEGELESLGVTITDQDTDFRQRFASGGLSLIVPVSTRVTLRGGISRTWAKTTDTDFVPDLGADLSLEERMDAWSVGGSVTLWLGNPRRTVPAAAPGAAQ